MAMTTINILIAVFRLLTMINIFFSLMILFKAVVQKTPFVAIFIQVDG